jgi:hypothetical protein
MPRNSSTSTRAENKSTRRPVHNSAEDEATRNGDTGEQDDRLKQELDELHDEMVVAQYGTDVSGRNFRRKLSHAQRKSRNRKRLELETRDMQRQQATFDLPTKRLRGSKASLSDEVIQGSLIIPQSRATGEDHQAVETSGAEESSIEEDGSRSAEENDEEGSNHDEDEEEEEEEYAGEDQESEAEAEELVSKPSAVSKSSKQRSTTVRRGRKRGTAQMRNFRSAKLAEKHGEALDAHTRGQHQEAIEKLKQVAQEAPSAPQVYSSLGMIYCDMMKEARTRSERTGIEGQARLSSDLVDDTGNATESRDELINLARKAYGAYHVAAVLCKKDCSLWIRIADIACEIADLHLEIMLLDLPENICEHHSSERLRWLNEAKNDYQTADSLGSSGIEAPTKLASVLMELGHLAEALTLLTDLKNRKSGNNLSEFESSYSSWWMYADLMLRIGHECNKWNSGDESTKNYMLRRWLRKHATTFDWQERRLRALIQALEAAAGNKSCKPLVDWLSQRAQSNLTIAASIADPSPIGNTESATASDGDQVRRETLILQERNNAELVAFDKTSGEMGLKPGQEPHTQRMKARQTLVQSQQSFMNTLLEEFSQSRNVSAASEQDMYVPSVESSSSKLSVSASINIVVRLASELGRLACDMKLYECGIHVGTSVSMYMKERARLLSERSQVEADNSFTTMASLPGLLQGQVNGDASDSEESQCHLSDDDELGSSPDTIELLSKGVLPPEISVVHGCCLACEGGKDFLAFNFLKSLGKIEQEQSDWLEQTPEHTDEALASFVSKWSGPFGRTAAFAFVARCLRRAEIAKAFSRWMYAMFDEQVVVMTAQGLVDVALNADLETGALSHDRIMDVAVILSSSSRFMLHRTEELFKTSNKGECKALVAKATLRAVRLLRKLWSIERDRSLHPDVVELISILQLAFHLSHEIDPEPEEMLQTFVPIKTFVDELLGNTQPIDFEAWHGLLIPSVLQLHSSNGWLPDMLEPLSLRVFNLCVATNVACFSGWCEWPFNFSLIRRIQGSNFFGIKIRDGFVSGTLSTFIENDLSLQWDLVRECWPDLKVPFGEKLAALRKEEAYLVSKRRHDEAVDERVVSQNGENDAISILLWFSEMCLRKARRDMSSRSSIGLVLTALSIILPPSQFCLGEELWDSNIGFVDGVLDISSRTDLDLFLHQSVGNSNNELLAPSKLPGFIRRNKRVPAEPEEEITVSFVGEDDSLSLSNFVAVPCSVLLSEWNHDDILTGRDAGISLDKMSGLSSCMHILRQCQTEATLEKASLNVAVALLAVATKSPNPFICLQQAARFASKAPKLGVSDLAFQDRLPNENECSPLDALIILGRADCLQAVFFCEEAAFLCNFVASVCSAHRRADPVMSRRWNIVSIMAYNVSVAIRYTSEKVVTEKEKRDDVTASWDQDVIKEISTGREYGLALINKGPTNRHN